MRRSRLLLLIFLLRSVVGELSRRPCFDACRNRTADAVGFEACVVACREAMMADHREEESNDDDEGVDGDDDGEERKDSSVQWLTGDILSQLARQDDDSRSEVAGDLPDPETDEESPIGWGNGAAGKRGDWRRPRGGGGGMGEPERMSFVRIGRTPSQLIQFSERPFVRILQEGEEEEEDAAAAAADDDDEDEDLDDDGLYPASEDSGRGNPPPPPDPVLRVRKSLRVEETERGAKRQSSFVRIGKSNNANIDRTDLNDRFAPIGIEPENRAGRSFAGVADRPLDGAEKAAGYPVRVGKSSSSKRPSFVRIGKSQLDAAKSEMLGRPEKKRSSSFVRIGKSLNEPRKRPSFVRIGKSLPTNKRPSFVRIGKSLPTNKRPSFVRIGKSLPTNKRPSFVRIGKSILTNKRPSFVRIGKSLSEKKRPSFVRIGRSRFPDVAYTGTDVKRAVSLAGDYNDFYRNEDGKRQSFVRIGRAKSLNDATHPWKPASYHQNHAMIPNSLEATKSQRLPSTESVSGATTWVPTVLGQVLRKVRSV